MGGYFTTDCECPSTNVQCHASKMFQSFTAMQNTMTCIVHDINEVCQKIKGYNIDCSIDDVPRRYTLYVSANSENTLIPFKGREELLSDYTVNVKISDDCNIDGSAVELIELEKDYVNNSIRVTNETDSFLTLSITLTKLKPQ